MISAYDAHTKYLDKDFRFDEERNDQVFEMKNRMIDMAYPIGELNLFWRRNPYSFLIHITHKEISNHLKSLQLLTKNTDDIKRLQNGYLSM